MGILAEADDKLLRVSEVEKMLRLSRPSVIDWIERGYLREVRLPSGQRRIRLSEVERVIAGEEKEAVVV